MTNFSGDQIWGIVRTILAAGLGYLATKGFVDEATATSVLSAIGVIFVAVWSWMSRRSDPQLKAALAVAKAETVLANTETVMAKVELAEVKKTV